MERIRFEWLGFWLIIIFGIAVRIVTPPFQVADELNHFPRAWQISEGKIFSPAAKVRDVENGANPTTIGVVEWACGAGGKTRMTLHNEDEKMLVAEVPSSMTPPDFAIGFTEKFHAIDFGMIRKFLETPLNLEQTELHLIPNTGQYSPLAYFPQALTAFVGRAMNLSAGVIYYAMGLSALIFAATCIFWSMKFLPEKRALLLLLAMAPIFLTEITSTSADAVIYGVGILGSAWLLSLRTRETPISAREIFGLIILAAALGLLKQVYGTILLLYFLIPIRRFKSLRQFLEIGLLLLILELIISAVWIYFAVEAQGVSLILRYYLGFEAVDLVAQKNFVLEHPLEFLKAFLKTLATPDAWTAWTFVDLIASYNLSLPRWFCVAYMAALTIFALFGRMELRPFERLTGWFAAFVTAIGVFGAQYLMWSSVGGAMVDGVQGRYFVPIALLIFCPSAIFPAFKHENLFAICAGIFSAAMTIWLTYTSFF